MMGIKKDQPELFSYIALEERIPRDHPLRKVKSLVDFGFVRQEVSGLYGYNGNESVDPAVILKLMFLLFFDRIKSERELMRQLGYRLDYLWFLGYGLNDMVPDHSVLSKARRRWGWKIFMDFFIRVVLQCVELGLVSGDKIYLDGTLVDANASLDSVVKGSTALIEQLKRVYLEQEGKLEEDAEFRVVRGEEEGGEEEGGEAGREEGSGTSAGVGSGDQNLNRGLVSKTDPEAAMVKKGNLASRPRYKSHRAVDDRCGVIVAVASTAGDVEENALLKDLVRGSEESTGIRVKTVVGDSQYGTVDNFRECMKLGIKPHMSDLSYVQGLSGAGRRSGIFGLEKFVYDRERDLYLCPGGEELNRRRQKKEKKAYEYGISGKVCNVCELKLQCTRSKTGRSIKRYEDQDLIDQARLESRSFEARADRRNRKHLGEGSFADAENNHGLKRSRWRRLWRQKIQDFLIAICQNIRIMIRWVQLDPALWVGKIRLRGLAERISAGLGQIWPVLDKFWRIRMVLGAVWKNWTEQPLAGGIPD